MSDDLLAQTRIALEPLWTLPAPGPENLSSVPAYNAFRQYCADTFPAADKGMGFSFALSDALRGAGLPCEMSGPACASTLDAGARAIVAAFEATTVRKRYLCPLDLADRLPAMAFGSATVASYAPSDLAALFDAERLARYYPTQVFDARGLAQFQWLVVEEQVEVAAQAGKRALPFLYENLGRDLGAFDPHAGSHPPAVTAALFALLLAPWEDWHSLETDWAGFNIPWIHVATDDLFVRPRPAPSSQTLTWEDASYQGDDGERVDYERPVEIRLDSDAANVLAGCDQDWWSLIETALATPLFETPIQHFMVRAAFSGGMDQIMAHMTAIEAALGMRADFRKPGGATATVTKRVATLLNDTQAGSDYADLFTTRSKFVHGRPIAGQISSRTRNLARRLARRVVVALIDAANGPDGKGPRASYLDTLA